jgi:PEP-CTERM/exosortase A-associated glycosyltransferase
MRVLHVLDHSLPLHSGYAFRSQKNLRAQCRAGLQPAVVTSPKHESFWKALTDPEEVIDGVRYYRSGASTGAALPFFAERNLMSRLERRIEAVLEQERAAVIHAHSPVLDALPALRVGRRRGVPVVYEIRAFWEDAAADLGTYSEGSVKYRIVQALETRACRRVDAVVVICEGLRSELLARGIPASKITVVPNGVDPEEFKVGEPDVALARQHGLEGKIVVGFLGSFYHYEGLDLLIDAAAILAPELPDLRVLLVGGGPMDTQIREHAARLGLEGRVVFTGRLPHDQMPGVYGLVDVLAYPRKPMRLTDLVTPLKPLEAMAMGKALVASDVGGHCELIRDGETGVLFRAGDVAALASQISRLVCDPALRKKLGAQGRTWVSRERTWELNGEAYLRLYERLRREIRVPEPR